MTMRSLIACAFVAGCSLDRAGTGAVAAPDSSAVIESDTGSIFEPEDAQPTEIDTMLVDSAPLESDPPDSTDADVETVTVTATPLGVTVRTLDLTAEGPRDWAHWGHTASDSFNRKLDGVAIVEGMASGASTFEGGVLRFTWTDGAPPNKSVTETPRGLTMSTVGEYIAFDVQGDPASDLTLDVWTSGTADATITGSITESTRSTTTTLGAGVYLVRFTFRTVVATSKLHVEVKKGPLVGTFNLFAAALK